MWGKKEIAKKIIKLIGNFVFLTSHYVTLFLRKEGVSLTQDKVYKLLRQLTSVKILSQYEFQAPMMRSNFRFFSLDYNGDKLYRQLFRAKPKWNNTTEITEAVYVKKYLTASQCIYAMRKNVGNISYQIAPVLGDNRSKVRPTAAFQYAKGDDEYHYLLEVVRKTSDWKSDLLEKLNRYNTYMLLKDRENTILIICGEDKEHIKSLFQVVEYWRNLAYDQMLSNQLTENRVWFTEDMASLSQKLSNTFVELYQNEQGILAVPIDISKHFTLVDSSDNNEDDTEVANNEAAETLIVSGYISRDSELQNEPVQSISFSDASEDAELRQRIIESCLSVGQIGDPIAIATLAPVLKENGVDYHEYNFPKLINLLNTQRMYLSIEGTGTEKYVKLIESMLTDDEILLEKQKTSSPPQEKRAVPLSKNKAPSVSALLHDIDLQKIPMTLNALALMAGHRVALVDLATQYQLECHNNGVKYSKDLMSFYTGFEHPIHGKVYMCCEPSSRFQRWRFKSFQYEEEL